ncbi:MAG: ABC transporter substrate-binding protein, partial [Desulfobacterales bacterium]|nr:ABC transporter substrate-binding protein [Desulfobacterales bacterium]
MTIQTYFIRRPFGVAIAATAMLYTGMALAQTAPPAKAPAKAAPATKAPAKAAPAAKAAAPAAAAAGAVNLNQTVKIVWLDPLSGLMAAVGQNQLKSYQFFAEEFSKKNKAGVKFEIIGIDNKLSPAETLNGLKSAIDQGVRYVVQGNGSGPALAIIDALQKHNERNPG